MDLETGEDYRDLETGELPARPSLNRETGEQEPINTEPPKYTCKNSKKPFRVPSSYTNTITESSTILHNACNRRAPIIFALLIIAFFIPPIGVVISITEILLHMWAHKKNKQLRNTNMYYESLFHDILCEFCRLCIEENSKQKITKLQDRSNNKFTKYSFEYVRRVVT